MAHINFVLSPLERQLVSLARSILQSPQVLLVHDQGFLPPDAAAKIGNVLQNYADGLALTRLGNAPRMRIAEHLSEMDGPAPAAVTALQRLQHHSLTSGETTPRAPRASSGASGGEAEVQSAVARARRADLRTVIWHADAQTLVSAGLGPDRHIEVSDGQLRRVQVRATSRGPVVACGLPTAVRAAPHPPPLRKRRVTADGCRGLVRSCGGRRRVRARRPRATRARS